MSAPFSFDAPERLQPCRPWFFVTEQGWSVIRIVPMNTVHMMMRGRGSFETIQLMINICATAIVINRIMGRPDFFGVPKFRGL